MGKGIPDFISSEQLLKVFAHLLPHIRLVVVLLLSKHRCEKSTTRENHHKVCGAFEMRSVNVSVSSKIICAACVVLNKCKNDGSSYHEQEDE